MTLDETHRANDRYGLGLDLTEHRGGGGRAADEGDGPRPGGRDFHLTTHTHAPRSRPRPPHMCCVANRHRPDVTQEGVRTQDLQQALQRIRTVQFTRSAGGRLPSCHVRMLLLKSAGGMERVKVTPWGMISCICTPRATERGALRYTASSGAREKLSHSWANCSTKKRH